MNKRSGAAAAYVVKWLIVPIILAALGFFFVGPRLTKPAPFERTGAAIPQSGVPAVDDGDKPKHQGQPNVEVSATPVRRISPARARRKRDPQKIEAPANGETPPPSAGVPGTSNPEETPSGRGG